MKYNIEKINEIGKMLAEVVGDAIKTEGAAEVRIGDVEMALRESLQEIGRNHGLGVSGERICTHAANWSGVIHKPAHSKDQIPYLNAVE